MFFVMSPRSSILDLSQPIDCLCFLCYFLPPLPVLYLFSPLILFSTSLCFPSFDLPICSSITTFRHLVSTLWTMNFLLLCCLRFFLYAEYLHHYVFHDIFYLQNIFYFIIRLLYTTSTTSICIFFLLSSTGIFLPFPVPSLLSSFLHHKCLCLYFYFS